MLRVLRWRGSLDSGMVSLMHLRDHDSGLLYPHQLGVFLTDYLVVILYVYALLLVPSSHGEPVTVEVA